MFLFLFSRQIFWSVVWISRVFCSFFFSKCFFLRNYLLDCGHPALMQTPAMCRIWEEPVTFLVFPAEQNPTSFFLESKNSCIRLQSFLWRSQFYLSRPMLIRKSTLSVDLRRQLIHSPIPWKFATSYLECYICFLSQNGFANTVSCVAAIQYSFERMCEEACMYRLILFNWNILTCHCNTNVF